MRRPLTVSPSHDGTFIRLYLGDELIAEAENHNMRYFGDLIGKVKKMCESAATNSHINTNVKKSGITLPVVRKESDSHE